MYIPKVHYKGRYKDCCYPGILFYLFGSIRNKSLLHQDVILGIILNLSEPRFLQLQKEASSVYLQ